MTGFRRVLFRSPANHTYTHPSLGRLPAAAVRTEIVRCAETLRSTTGSAGAWFRPSALAVPTPLVIREAVAAGYRPLGRAEPDPAHRTLYDDLYERYQALLGSRVVR